MLSALTPGRVGRAPMMPPDAPQVALADIERLNLHPTLSPLSSHWTGLPITATWHSYAGDPHLLTILRGDCRRIVGHPVHVRWRWRTLWSTNDWHEIGWHPDEQIYLVRREWSDLLWDALNQGRKP